MASALFTCTAACSLIATPETTPAPVIYIPDTAGIVATFDSADQRYELTDGLIVALPEDVQILGASDPDPGDLLLYGTEPVPWLHGTRALDPKPLPEPGACYVLWGKTRANATHVFKTIGDPDRGEVVIVLLKAPGWMDSGYVEGDLLRGSFTCVNHRGQATEQRPDTE